MSADRSLSSQSATTLVQRAAVYFGWQDKPRRSIRLNNVDCLIVGEVHGGKTIVMHYSEDFGRPKGTFIKLTDRALAELLDALTEAYDRAL